MVRTKKRIRFLLLCLIIMAVFTASLFYLNQNVFNDFSLTISNNNDGNYINWWYNQEDNHYYLFVPGNYDTDKAIVKLKYFKYFTIDGEKIENKSSFSRYLNNDSEYLIVDSKNNEYILDVVVTSKIPTLYVETEIGGLEKIDNNKDYKSQGEAYYDNGNSETNEYNLKYIKTRGNATFLYKKKSYSLEFLDGVNIYGDHLSQKIELIANYVDSTSLRNVGALKLANQFGFEAISDTLNIDLYINGEYQGIYTICEKLTKQFDTTLGYELRRRESGCDDYFYSKHGQLLSIENNASRIPQAQIEELYNDFEEALFSEDGYNSKGKYYSEYCDVDNLAKAYLFYEIVANLDSGTTSSFIAIVDNKFYYVCPWDFDVSLCANTDRYQINLSDYRMLWARYNYLDCCDDNYNLIYNIFYYLYLHEDFRQNVKTLMNDGIYNEISYLANTDFGHDEIKKSLFADRIVNHNGTISNKETIENKLDVDYETMITYLKNRNERLLNYLNSESHQIIYKWYDKTLELLDNREMVLNEDEYYTILDCSSYGFVAWNTVGDGSGDWYYPGNKVYSLDEDLVLYAIYDY